MSGGTGEEELILKMLNIIGTPQDLKEQLYTIQTKYHEMIETSKELVTRLEELQDGRSSSGD